MIFKTTLNYSPNFSVKKRDSKKIKFLIFHYTGMKKQSEAINRLTDIKSKVSSHYFIRNNGKIITMVPELYTAWHAGVSFWKNFNSLNKNSIGIEINNPGHDFKYKKFSKKQINSVLLLTKFLVKKYKIKQQNILGHSDIAPNRKKDPGEKFPWEFLFKNKIGFWHNLDKKELIEYRTLKINDSGKKKFYKNILKIGYSEKNLKNSKLKSFQYKKILIKAFQRRFRQDLVNGIADQECLIISKNLVK
ncbi:N-acetylmuramoyl-L-alanine amidase [Candidatus Pelagibacter sp.]|nr:N-acetylmuramoyl-L-alanine amidase [Candidatus Pelagibacter sp.]